MNWDAIGAIAELLGALGVIGSLIYVATQVRRGTIATRLDTAIRVMESSLKLTDPLTRSREFSQLASEIVGGKPIDSVGDGFHVHSWMFGCLKTVENAHYLYEQGVLEEEVWLNWEEWWKDWLQQPGFTGYWYHRRSVFRQSFRAVVDGWVGAPPEPTGPDQVAAPTDA